MSCVNASMAHGYQRAGMPTPQKLYCVPSGACSCGIAHWQSTDTVKGAKRHATKTHLSVTVAPKHTPSLALHRLPTLGGRRRETETHRQRLSSDEGKNDARKTDSAFIPKSRVASKEAPECYLCCTHQVTFEFAVDTFAHAHQQQQSTYRHVEYAKYCH
jgi:hypothetical protein